ncbi:DUF6380 family protein [Streptomyces sp. enrichment culture]|uniref:DUF6380 family protein n=1 Tax=Streptomyces sp. enrichment culture TaxID=1795815 RepID=UPI003F57D2FD
MVTPGTLDPSPSPGPPAAARRATLRWRPASLTETVCRTPVTHHGDRTGKGAP